MWKKRLVKTFKVILIALFLLFVLLSVLPYFFSVEEKQQNRSEMPFPNSSFLEYKKTRLHYRMFMPDSVGNYMLLIHGFSGSTFSFRKNAKALADSGICVVALDLPAFGFSDKSDTATYNETDRADMIKQIITKVAPNKKWTVAGHSMGAAVAGQFATRYPASVRSLIFIDGPAFGTKGSGPAWFAFMLRYPPLLRWAEVIAKHKFVNQPSFMELLGSAYGKIPEKEEAEGYMRPFTLKGSASAIFRMSAMSGTAEIKMEVLNKIPSLLIWGTADAWIPFKTGKEFATQNPAMEVYQVKGAGHCPMETHAAEVNQKILDFVKKMD